MFVLIDLVKIECFVPNLSKNSSFGLFLATIVVKMVLKVIVTLLQRYYTLMKYSSPSNWLFSEIFVFKLTKRFRFLFVSDLFFLAALKSEFSGDL